MSSWIYILSKFTPEALLFEALLICVLISSYAAFWVLRKRRFGAVENEVPSSVVKVYLNELIGEAEDMRTQLFGLLSGGAPRPHHAAHADAHAHASGPSFAVSGDTAEKLAALERKMSEQASAIEKIMSEKAKLEKELSDARASGAGAAASSTGGEDVQKLQEKCQSLEARLAEYSVIEDDLANLKRLQQENTQLKHQLANTGSGATAAGPAMPATPAATETPAAPAPEAVAAPAEAAPTPAAQAAPSAPAPEAPAEKDATSATAAVAAAAAVDAPSSAPMGQDATQAMLDSANAPSTSPAANPAANAFEGLVDEVEKSLQPNSPAEATPAAQAAQPAPAAEAKAEKTPEKVSEKTDEDLIAEFEKMLNS